jgi:hypothetical protein
MPLAIDESKMQQGTNQILSMDPAKPPTKSIPHADFPRVVYKHPREPFLTIEHRNAKHELVEEEIVPAEHLTKVVADEVEMKAALAEGWVKEQYIPKPIPDRNAHVYDRKGKTA